MPQARPETIYRLHTVSKLGSIRKIELLRLMSDDAACRYASLVIEGDPIEVWRQGRRLVVLEPAPVRLQQTVRRHRKAGSPRRAKVLPESPRQRGVQSFARGKRPAVAAAAD
jgi:hypothetical protein